MADDIATLGFAVDTKPLEQAALNMKAVEAAAKRLGITVDEMQAKIRGAGIVQKLPWSAPQIAEVEKALTSTTTAGKATAEAMVQLDRSFANVARSIQSFATQLGPVGADIARFGPAGLAVATSLGAMALGFHAAAQAALKLAEEVGKLNDTADTIGLTVEQLRALQLIGGEVGISSEKLTSGLEKFSATLGQVREGAKGATENFDKLSPGLADGVRNAKTMDEALQLVFQALQKADTAAASLAARELFGRGGAGFVRLAAAATDVTKLAQSVNSLDVITTQQARTWDQLGDSIARNMGLARTNVTASFAEPVLQVLSDVSNIVVELSRTFRLLVTPIAEGFKTDAIADFRAEIQTLNFEIQKFGTDIAVTDLASRLFGDDFVGQVQRIIAQLNAIAAILNSITSLFGAAGQATNAFFTLNSAKLEDAQARASAAFKSIGDASSTLFTSEFNGRVDTFASRFNAATGAVGTGAKEWFKFGNQMETIGNIVLDTIPPKFGKASAAVKDAGKDALDALEILRNNVTALGGAATAAEKYQLQVAELAKKLQEGTISQDTFNRAVSQLDPTVIQLKSTIDTLASALTNAFVHGKDTAEALNSALKSVAATASSDVIKKLLTGATGGGFDISSIATGGLIAAGATLLSKLFGGGDKAAELQKQQAAAAEAEQARVAREKEIADAQIRAADYSLRAAAAMEKSDFINRIKQFDAESQKAFDEESKRAGDVAIWQLVAARAAERTKLIADTIEEATNTLAGDQMSEVQKRLQEIAEAADTLGKALEASGISAEEAATTVSEKLNVALEDLSASFTADLTSKINDLKDLGWVNNLNDLIAELAQMKADAAALGTDTGQVDQFGVLAAQKLIDEAKLTGPAFEQVASAMGVLGDQLHEFKDVVEELSASDFMDSLIRQVNDLAGGSWINQAEDLISKVAEMRAAAASLGIDTELITNFYVLSAQKIVDENQLTGASFDALEAQLGLAGTSLHEFNAAVAETANVAVRSAQEISSAIQSNEDALFSLQHASGSLADQLAVFDLQAQRQREAEIAAGGQALVSLEALQAQQRLNIINNFNAQQLAAQQQAQQAAAESAQRAREEQLRAEQQAAQERKRILDEATKFLTGALQNIANWIQHFLAGSQSTLSPAARLASAQSSFTTQRNLALGGNREALSGITQNAQDVIDAATAYYGSSAAGQAIISDIITQLQSLPAQVSAEQFIVDGLTTPIQAVQTQVSGQTSTLNSALSSQTTALQTAIAANNPVAIATALSNNALFQSIDQNTDNALSFAEMQSALGATYSAGTLRSIFNELDNNGNGLLEKSELIKTATQGTATSTSSTATSAATTVTNTSNIATSSGGTANSTASTAVSTNTISGYSGTISGNTGPAGSISQNTLNTKNSVDDVWDQQVAANNLQTTANGILNAINNQTAFLSSINNLTSIVAANAPYLSTIASWTPGSQHAAGGYITGPGTGTSDSTPAWLSSGEYVVNSADTAWARPMLDVINFQHQMPGVRVGGSEISVVDAIMGLRQDIAQLARITGSGSELVAERVGEVVQHTKSANKAVRRAAA